MVSILLSSLEIVKIGDVKYFYWANRQTDGWTDRQTDRQDRWTDRQTDKTDGQKEEQTNCLNSLVYVVG